MFVIPDRVWKKTRRETNPMFHPRNLEHMHPVFNRNSRLLVSCLAEHVGKLDFDISHHTMDIGLLTVCSKWSGLGNLVKILSNYKSCSFCTKERV